MMVEEIREKTLGFVAGMQMPECGTGFYRYSLVVEQPTLYSSTYAVLTRALHGDLRLLSDEERQGWIRTLNSFQDEDAIVRWLEACDWGERVAFTGNEIMNVGCMLQYARDFHNDEQAGRCVSVLLDWLSSHHIDAETGVWGFAGLSDPLARSHAVQAAYHWWPLFFYDNYSIPDIERAIDTVLGTQNAEGGFGWGVHNPDEPFKSSACEDIDSIDPLCRMMQCTDYRREEIVNALTRAADWVLRNQMDDGGFVFILDSPFEYGHRQLRGEANTGAMFPTWFRTLSLALIGKALPSHPLGQLDWHFARCPGGQFWG